ncbi:hypothetical protein LTR39_001650, partial [Cryomyces antarcticus]
VGSSDTSEEKIGKDRDRFVSDLRELADMLAEKHFRLAYENWCWSTHAPYWRDVWDIVQKVDRHNIGLCLDTFQTAGGEWADPTTISGLLENERKEMLEEDFQISLDDLSEQVPKDKIYFQEPATLWRRRRRRRLIAGWGRSHIRMSRLHGNLTGTRSTRGYCCT